MRTGVWRVVVRWAIGLAIALALAIGLWALVSVSVDRPVAYAEITEHFKYGSIGSEPGGSLLQTVGGVLPPYWIFRALPEICPDKLPGGYASLGLVMEANHDRPVGISRRRRLGIDQAGFNCAACHASTVRDAPGAPARVFPGMPAHTLDLERLVRFVLDCTLDNRLTAENVAGHLPTDDGPSLFERTLLRVGLIDRLKLTTLNLRNRMAPLFEAQVPQWGPGRVDTFNPYKAIQFNWHLDQLPDDEKIGASDFPSLWNQKPREGLHLHWDGDNDSVDERNLSAALGAGVTPVTVDHASIQRIKDWIWTLPPPAYPYPIDRALATQGATVYQQQCASCHADHRFRDGIVPAGGSVGQVEDIDAIQTDPHRLNSYTAIFALNQYGLYPESPYRFTHFRKTHGYANQPLDGIWLRGPYLHNGSVPTLRDLLEPPERRPVAFYRGYDVFDRDHVGFVSNVASAEGRTFFKYDTSIPGNGNGGHTYGTTLSDADKRAIVEYLKTF
jgi:mono/diheme cytochrome c family protein